MYFHGIARILMVLNIIEGFRCEPVQNNKLSYEAQLENFLALTADFFTGLYDFKQFNNPDIEVNSTTFARIDSIVDHYIHTIKKAHRLLSPEEVTESNSKIVQRRNAPPTNPANEFKLNKDELALRGFEEINAVPSQFPIDIILFDKTFVDERLPTIQYAASLEIYYFRNQSLVSYADTLVLYKYVNGYFNKVFSIPISKATKLLSRTIDGKIYIVVASKENGSEENYNWRGSILFEVDTWKDVLVPVQMLGTYPACDVTFWDDYGHTYLGLAGGNPDLSDIGGTKSVIYRWLGGHFDIVDNLMVNDARKIIEFVIDSDRFIVLANHKDEHGLTATYSFIYRYDLHEEKFVIYQHLSTHAAVDVKYFSINVDHESIDEGDKEQHFLVIANQYETDLNGDKEFRTSSILYKFSDNYFVPFQGFELYSASEWLPFMDPNGKPLLLVNCFYEGLRAFNYDGWKFVEAPLEFGGAALGRGIASMRMQYFLGQPVLVVSNPSDESSSHPNIFRPIFRSTTSLSTEKANLLAWCQSRLAQATQLDAASVVDQIKYAPKTTDPVVNVKGTIDFADEVHIAKLSTDAIWTDNYLIDDTVLRNINNLNGDLKYHMGYLDALLNKSDTLIRTDLPIKFRGSLSAPSIISTSTKLDQIETKFLNNRDFDEIRHKILQNQLSDVLEFDKLTIDSSLEFRQINGRPIDSLIFKNRDHTFENLIIDNALIQKNLKTSFINNALFDASVLILNNTEQYFDFLDVNNLKTRLINSPILNNVDVTQKREVSYYTTDGDLKISDLRTDTMNGINIEMLYIYSLKKYGDQKISAEYELPELYANNFVGPELSNVRPENLINIKEGSFDLDQDVALKGSLNVQQDLRIINRLNNIPVLNGELQVLLKDSDKPQKILGNKVFESVELLDPIDLHGMINSSALDRMNPVSSISEDLILEGDFILDNLVTIRKHLRSDEIVASTGNTSPDYNAPTISNLLVNGLLLDSQEISIPIEFTQPFKTSNLNISYINQKPVESWACSTKPTVINSKKTFLSNLQVSGSCKLLGIVNGINIQEMFNNTLLMNSDHPQKVEGRVVFEQIKSERLISSSITLNSKPISSYLTRSTDQYLSQGIVFAEDQVCSAENVEANYITISGQPGNDISYDKLNLLNAMNSMYSDCVTNVDNRRVSAPKTFRNLTVAQLNVKNDEGITLTEHKKRVIRHSNAHPINYEEPIHISNPIHVHKLTFTGTLDGVSNLDFGSRWLLTEGDQIINAPITISKVITEQPITLDGHLNGVNLKDLEKSVLYINRNYDLPNVHFENGFTASAQFRVNQNQISEINLNDFVLKDSPEMQYISGNKKITSLNIKGRPVLTKGLLGHFDIENYCKFFDNLSMDELNLKILGSAKFVDDIDVTILNNYDLNKLLNEVWYSNVDTVVSGIKIFKDAQFKSHVTANNLINDIDLNWLNANYFSLSRNQTITGNINFREKTNFLANVLATSPVELYGALNDIPDLVEFRYDSLDKTSEQNLIGKFTFDKLTISGDLHGIINNIDFEYDVLRYDSSNDLVIGNKVFDNIFIESLELNQGATINDLDIEAWFQNSVVCYSEKELFVLEPPVILSNGGSFVNGINTSGTVNGHFFNRDKLLLKYSDQTITGAKAFLLDHNSNSINMMYEPTLFVNNLRVALLESFLNDIIILNNDDEGNSHLVYSGKGLKFENQLDVRAISGKVSKSSALIYGVDLPAIQNEISNISSILNYQTMNQDFAYLNYMAGLLKHNIESQARFLHHYEVVQQIEGDVVFNNTSNDVYSEVLNIYKDNKIQVMNWNRNSTKFEYQLNHQIDQELRYIGNDIYSINSLNYAANGIPIVIENKECLIVLDSESVLKCKMDYALDYVALDKFFTPGAKLVDAAKSKLGTLLVFLLQQKSKQGLPIGSVLVYLVTDLNQKNPSKLLQTLRPTRPTSISLVVNTKINTEYDLGSSSLYYSYKGRTGLPEFTTKTSDIQNSEQYSFISEESDVFLAITSDKVQRAMHHGLVEIYRFNPSKQLFELSQSVPSMAPQQVQFAVLPISNELVLYVLSRQQARPLTILLYEGVAGFREIFAASTIPHGNKLTTLTTKMEHFVFIGHQNYTTVLRARFEDLHG